MMCSSSSLVAAAKKEEENKTERHHRQMSAQNKHKHSLMHTHTQVWETVAIPVEFCFCDEMCNAYTFDGFTLVEKDSRVVSYNDYDRRFVLRGRKDGERERNYGCKSWAVFLEKSMWMKHRYPH